MDDFKLTKFDMNRKVVNGGIMSTKESSRRAAMARRKKRQYLSPKNAKILSVIVILLVLSGVFLAVKTYAIYKDAKKTYAQAKVVEAVVKQQNVVQVKGELLKTQADIASLQKDINSIGLVGYIPLVGGYYNDGRHLVNASAHGVNAAIITTDSLIPYADVLGLKGGGSFSAGSAQDRIRMAVNTLGKVVPKIDDIENEMLLAKAEVDQVDIDRYPNFWFFKKARNEIGSVKNLTDEGTTAVEQGKPLIKVLPDLLGQNGSKKYLILFQNDKELRPTGGFLTYYSIFNVDQGVITVDTSSDIYSLDDSIPSHPPAPYIISNFLPGVDQWYIRDSNLSPDFKLSMDQFNKFYKQSSDYQNVDGIIAIDTQFLVHVLDILGEVQADGQTFNSQNDARCDCPQVVFALENQISRPVNYIKTNRKGLLGDLLYATMQKALSSSPKEYWGKLVQQGIADAEDKHILFDLYDPGAQQGIEALNWGGRIQSFKGDYLNINDANFGGQKSNLFVRSKVKINYAVGQDGTINKTITINYVNNHPHSDCSLASGGLCLNARLRDFQRVYVPLGSTLTSAKGAGNILTKEDLGKTYFQGFFFVDPMGQSVVTYSYNLPFKLQNGKELPVMIQKQPGTYDVPYEIDVNGTQKESFNLTSDKQFMLPLQ